MTDRALKTYDGHGSRNPRWDPLARAAIVEFMKPTEGENLAVAPAATRAVDAGCDDAFIFYLAARAYAAHRHADEMLADARLKSAAVLMAESTYPADRKLSVLMYCRNNTKDPKPLPPDTVLDLLVDAAQTPGMPEASIGNAADDLMVDMTTRDGREPAFNRIYPVLQKALPKSALPLLFKGKFYKEWAWDARGSGWASTVTPEGGQLMEQRLATAQCAGERVENRSDQRPHCRRNDRRGPRRGGRPRAHGDLVPACDGRQSRRLRRVPR